MPSNKSLNSGASTIHSDTSGPELCRAEYRARQFAGSVVLYAMGVHPSAGCVVFFKRESGSEFPPSFSLWHIRSAASELHAVTPFSASVTFQTIKRVVDVIVTDAAGSHRVAVEQSN